MATTQNRSFSKQTTASAIHAACNALELSPANSQHDDFFHAIPSEASAQSVSSLPATDRISVEAATASNTSGDKRTPMSAAQCDAIETCLIDLLTATNYLTHQYKQTLSGSETREVLQAKLCECLRVAELLQRPGFASLIKQTCADDFCALENIVCQLKNDLDVGVQIKGSAICRLARRIRRRCADRHAAVGHSRCVPGGFVGCRCVHTDAHPVHKEFHLAHSVGIAGIGRDCDCARHRRTIGRTRQAHRR